MVIGHNTLMKVMDHMGAKGVKTSRYMFPRTRSSPLVVMLDAKPIGLYAFQYGFNNNMATSNASWSRATLLCSLAAQSWPRCR